MNLQSLILITSLVLISACAGTANKVVSVDPGGTFEISSKDDGQPFTATLNISGTPGALGGTVKRHDFPQPFRLSDVATSPRSLGKVGLPLRRPFGKKMVTQAEFESAAVIIVS